MRDHKLPRNDPMPPEVPLPVVPPELEGWPLAPVVVLELAPPELVPVVPAVSWTAGDCSGAW